MVGPMIQSFTNNLKQQSLGYAMRQPASGSVPEESKDGVREIKSYAELEGLLKSSLGVVADFWSPSCGPCMMFKPVFHSFAEANKNSKLSFCSINVQNNHETANVYRIQAIPTIYFFYKGNVVGSFQGANEEALRAECEKLRKTIEDTHPHTSIDFLNFQPESNEIQLEQSQKQVASMATSVTQLVENSPNKEVLEPLVAWVSSKAFSSANPCTKALMENIFSLMKEVELDKRLALIDLLRISVVYSKDATLYMLQTHFDDIQNLLTSPISEELAAPKKKTFFILAYILKMLSNSFAHPEVARLLLSDQKYYAILIYLLTTAFATKNATVVYSASILAYNMVISAEDKKALEDSYPELIQGLSRAAAIDKLDAATMYWLGYACAVCLYMCSVEVVREMGKSGELKKMVEVMGMMENEKLKKLGEDIRKMIEICLRYFIELCTVCFQFMRRWFIRRRSSLTTWSSQRKTRKPSKTATPSCSRDFPERRPLTS
eukprot:TRINITY_DN1716_c0_g1_i11.p1 TRINITY_DN1716_c0_g1~~TRINITY_DN1716_c0_g1_i11.p1  ORF type:complete len:491 (+),score=123.04 TRINITY_DN1716_c0_g1_i11:335-1807(+)